MLHYLTQCLLYDHLQLTYIIVIGQLADVPIHLQQNSTWLLFTVESNCYEIAYTIRIS